MKANPSKKSLNIVREIAAVHNSVSVIDSRAKVLKTGRSDFLRQLGTEVKNLFSNSLSIASAESQGFAADSPDGFALLKPVANSCSNLPASRRDLLIPRKMMSPEEYIEQRLNDQIGWYDRKSSTNQSWFKRLRFAEIVADATIPFLSGFAGDSLRIKIAIGALGVVVAVIASLLGLLHVQEHWINYRATAEALKTQKFLFLTQTQPYDKQDAFHLLVQRVEALLSKENTEWTQAIMKPSKEESGS